MSLEETGLMDACPTPLDKPFAKSNKTFNLP